MNLHEHWRGRERYTVFDSAYGDGASVRALLDAWRADPLRPARLHVVALADGLQPGFHRIPQGDPGLSLDLLAAPLDAALAQLSASLDAIRLHDVTLPGAAFARPLARITSLGARLASSCLGEEQRTALQAQGFKFDGEEAVFASRKPRLPVLPTPERIALVIGAGLAGSSAAYRLCARGWDVTLLERHPHPAMEASGNLAGIFMPLLSRDDNIPTRLTRAAYLYALRLWEQLGALAARSRARPAACCNWRAMPIMRKCRAPSRRRASCRPISRAGWSPGKPQACWACRRRMGGGCFHKAAGRVPAVSAKSCLPRADGS